jgi:signal transduction histidine kinase/CheY-like chemotaxis protein
MLLTLLLGFLRLHPLSLAPFFAVPIIVITSVIVGRRWLLLVTLATCLGVSALVPALPREHVTVYTMAVLIGALSAVAAWLSTQNLYVAIQWAMYSQKSAQGSLEALRDRRAELRHMSDMLRHNQDRMHYLNVSLEQAKVAAEEAYRTKQHFVANVSHELRTPLNLITGFSEMMAFSPESYGGVRLPAVYHEDVMEIYRSSKHLLGLVEDVLSLAQLEAGQMIVQRDWTDLRPIIQEAADTLRPLIEAKGLKLVVDLPENAPPTLVDAGRIRQVLLNLLNNAYRFTESGAIGVSMVCDAAEVRVTVSDTGVGIAPEDLPRVFEQFRGLSGGPAARRDGFGLGLSISRRLMQAHGGRLWAESSLGQGSQFRLSLPLQPPDDAAPRPTLVRTAPLSRPESAKAVILEIGDEAGAEIFDRHLSDYRIVHATPVRALSAYEHYLPSAIWLSDGVAPEGLPRFLAPVMRRAPSIPVIACRMPTNRDMARRFHAHRFLAKPITREKLERTLAELAAERSVDSVLVIDDDPSMLRLIERTLRSLPVVPGCVLAACGGQEGLDMLAAERPDLVLLDLAMPEISGYDVLRVIHEEPAYAHVLTVLMTGIAIGEGETPVYTIAVQSQTGFSLQRSLALIKAMVDQLSTKVTEAQSPESTQ